MTIVNNNKLMIDRPVFEQLTSAPANSAAGTNLADDGYRFIYLLLSATSFWRYDTFADAWQPLASPPGGTVAAATAIRYVNQMGGQINGETHGSVYALIASGTAVVFYRYDIATNTWSALSVTNVPSAWGTESRLCCPEPSLNAYDGGYHSNVALNTITATATANINATSISVSALPLALPIGARLNFGTLASPVWAVLTAAAAVSATSITVSPLIAAVNSAAVAYWYADMFLVGHNAIQMYRYNIVGNAWSTTSANAGNPALPAMPAAVGTGCGLAWLPGSGQNNAINQLIVTRGAATANLYAYDLTSNAIVTVAYNPASEVFGLGSSQGVLTNGLGKQAKLLIRKDNTGRVHELNLSTLKMTPRCQQSLIAEGTAVAGDKTCVMRSPDGIDYLFMMLNTSAYFIRTGLFF